MEKNSLLLDFEIDDNSEDSEIEVEDLNRNVIARNNTPTEDLSNLKVLKTTNFEVLDLNDL